MLVDSNIILYAWLPEHVWLRRFIESEGPVVSAISYVETLGYPKLRNEEKIFLKRFFAATIILPISQGITETATQLRQQRKMSLGDALIAATALVYQILLITRNTDDFIWIKELDLRNPFENSSA